METKLAIQVKQYTEGNEIGRGEMQTCYFMEVQDSSIDGSVVVTTSRFITPAEEWANEHGVKLIDGDDFVGLIQEDVDYDILNRYAPSLRTSSVDPGRCPGRAGTTERPDPE